MAMTVIDITIPSLASKKFDANVHAKIRTAATAIATGMLTPNLTPYTRRRVAYTLRNLTRADR